MGKIRVATLGDEAQEKKHKEFFFAARPAKFIKIILEKPNQCFHDELRVQVLKFI